MQDLPKSPADGGLFGAKKKILKFFEKNLKKAVDRFGIIW